MTDPSCSNTGKSFLCMLLFGVILGNSHAKEPELLRGKSEELAEIRSGELSPLLEVISKRDQWFLVKSRSGAFSNHSRITGWKLAKKSLIGRLPEVRSKLTELLDSSSSYARRNALDILLHDELGHRRLLKEKVITLLDDESERVQERAVDFLGSIIDEEIEKVLVDRLIALTRINWKNRDLVAQYIVTIARKPIVEDRVIEVLLHVFDYVTETRLLDAALRASKQFRSSKKYGLELNERYWQILSTTGRQDLPLVVTETIDEKDPQSLGFLLKTPEVKNAAARKCAAAKLMSHTSFDPVRRSDLFALLLEDEDKEVRRDLIWALGSRRDLSASYRIKTILKGFDQEPPIEGMLSATEPSIYGSLFNVLKSLPPEERRRLLLDENLKLGERIARDYEKKEFQQLIRFQTLFVMENGELQNVSSDEERFQKIGEWWRQFSPEKPE